MKFPGNAPSFVLLFNDGAAQNLREFGLYHRSAITFNLQLTGCCFPLEDATVQFLQKHLLPAACDSFSLAI